MLQIWETFTAASKNEMVCNSLSFGNKLQMMVRRGKECGFTSNFDMPRLFTAPKFKLLPKMTNSQSDYRVASCCPE